MYVDSLMRFKAEGQIKLDKAYVNHALYDSSWWK